MIEENYMGLSCPEPVVKCKEFLSKQQIEEFVIFVDNEASSENLERFLKKNAYNVVIEKESDEKWKLFAKFDNNKASVESKEERKGASKERTLFVISSQFFGSGDVVLGTKLMENFLNTLPNYGDSLWRLILLNSAVKISTSEGKILESLLSLEKRGINILVCGTCLEFYGLTSQKKVGETTNMLDVVTSLDFADKVIHI